MSESKFYKYATFGLILINLVILSVFFVGLKPLSHGGPNRHLGKNPHDLLQLSESQKSEFYILAEAHIEKVKDIDREQKRALEKYFKQLTLQSQANEDSILTEVNKLESQKIRSTYEHLEEVKALLKDDQSIHFEKFIQHVLADVLGSRQERRPPPRRK